MKRIFTYLVIVLILQGCASASLKVEVDLFDLDPTGLTLTTPVQADAIVENAVSLQSSADSIIAADLAWIEQANFAIDNAWTPFQSIVNTLAGQPCNSWEGTCLIVGDNKGELKNCPASVYQLYSQQKGLKEKRKDLADKVADLVKLKKSYVQLYSDAIEQNETRLRQKASQDADSEAGCKSLQNKNTEVPTTSDRTPSETVSKDCSHFALKLSEPVLLNGSSEQATLIEAHEKMKAKAREVAAIYEALTQAAAPSFSTNDLARSFADAFRATAGSDNKAERQRLNEIMIRLQQQIQFLSARKKVKLAVKATGNTSTGQTFGRIRSQAFEENAVETLQNLAKGNSRFLEQIDRLQNVGDPVWRIVTDPRYEQHWNKRSSQTFFEADGVASVTIVRDSPMHFRAFHADNSVADIVKGQLNIARAVGDAAMSIVGANIGLQRDVSEPADGQTVGQLEFKPSSDASGQADLVKLEKQTEAKEKALVIFRERLKALQTQLQPLDPTTDKDAITSINAQLKALAKGYQGVFALGSSASADDADDNNAGGQP